MNSDEMFQTQNRSRCRVCLLRAGHVRTVRAVVDCAAHDLLEGMRRGLGATGPWPAIPPPKKRSDPEGERVLLLSLRWIVRRGCNRGVVFIAVHVSDPVHGRLRGGFVCLGHLVHAGRAQTG